jgi:uncharacterized membrane protein
MGGAGVDPRAAPAIDPSEGLWGSGEDIGRILALSDGVFAFAMTLLVINLAFPTLSAATGGAGSPPAQNLTDYLTRLAPALGDYAFAFFTVVAWWSLHHRIFSVTRRYDPGLVRRNNAFLFLISVTPFLLAIVFTFGPGKILATNLNAKIAVAIFCGTQVALALLLVSVWRKILGPPAMYDGRIGPEWIASLDRQLWTRVILFAVTFGLAFLLPIAAEFGLAGVVIYSRVGRPPRSKAPRAPDAPAAEPPAAGP